MQENLFPARLMVARNANFGLKFEFEIDHSQIPPQTLKNKVRQACRDFFPELYFFEIKLDNPKAQGEGKKGPIPINNLGKWVFGVPRFKGHYMQDISDKTKLIIWIPKDSPTKVRTMFTSLTTNQILDS
jgi:hypothetical protein